MFSELIWFLPVVIAFVAAPLGARYIYHKTKDPSDGELYAGLWGGAIAALAAGYVCALIGQPLGFSILLVLVTGAATAIGTCAGLHFLRKLSR